MLLALPAMPKLRLGLLSSLNSQKRGGCPRFDFQSLGLGLIFGFVTGSILLMPHSCPKPIT
jgi:hypothetical protein